MLSLAQNAKMFALFNYYLRRKSMIITYGSCFFLQSQSFHDAKAKKINPKLAKCEYFIQIDEFTFIFVYEIFMSSLQSQWNFQINKS